LTALSFDASLFVVAANGLCRGDPGRHLPVAGQQRKRSFEVPFKGANGMAFGDKKRPPSSSVAALVSPTAKDFDDAARAVMAADLAEELRLSLIVANRLRAWGAEQGRLNRLRRAMENENWIESPPIAP
jgi:hypothetical protein